MNGPVSIGQVRACSLHGIRDSNIFQQESYNIELPDILNVNLAVDQSFIKKTQTDYHLRDKLWDASGHLTSICKWYLVAPKKHQVISATESFLPASHFRHRVISATWSPPPSSYFDYGAGLHLDGLSELRLVGLCNHWKVKPAVHMRDTAIRVRDAVVRESASKTLRPANETQSSASRRSNPRKIERTRNL
uniref:Uncharacterized protein n=1 Tax=Romanomermis culicivorax TaxID=13658 RepID=A0A915IEH7_ROMCU